MARFLRWGLLACLLGMTVIPVDAQAPPTQCISTALAGGTGDAITTPQLPCGSTTTMLLLTTTATNSTTTPTIQPVGMPAQRILKYDGTLPSAGDIVAGAKLLFTYNGSNWFLLNGQSQASQSPLLTGGLGLCNGFASCSGQSTTGTTSVGGNVLTLANAIDFSSSCQSAGRLNCGIMIGSAGPAVSVGPPTGFAVSTNCPFVQSQTGNTVTGSPIITNTLAQQGIAVGDKITGTGIPANTTITQSNPSALTLRISANATATNTGTALTIQDPCTASYFYKIASFDSHGGLTNANISANTSSGPVQQDTWNVVCLNFGAPGDSSSPAGYAIWKSVDGGATYHFWLSANVDTSGSCSLNSGSTLLDGGQPSQTRPWWIPDDPTTIAASGQPQWLATTIAGGGGTTSLTLAAAATTAASNVPVYHDDTAGWAAWIAGINASGANGQINAPAQVRMRVGGTLTASNARVTAQRGAVALPVGPLVGPVIQVGNTFPSGSFTTAGNLQEGFNCVPLSSISGISVGQYLVFSQAGPGGPSEALPYVFTSPVMSLQCGGVSVGVKLADAAPITFTDQAHTETATISGAPAVGDTVAVTVAGEISCTATYTIIGGDTLTSVARGLALKWNSGCSAYAVATHTGAIVTLQVPNYYQTITWSQATGHGGGGTEAIALAPGTGYTVTTLANPITNSGVSGLRVDGRDAMGLRGNAALIGVYSLGATVSNYKDLEFVNFGGGAASLYTTYGYGNIYDSIYAQNGAGGSPNVSGSSYSDIWITNETRSKINNITSVASRSFSVQFEADSLIEVNGVTQGGANYGRGIKFAGVIGSQIVNAASENAVFDNFVICCGTYRNQFTNMRSINAYGVNPDGISMFDAWDRLNTFTNIKSVGNHYDIIALNSDYPNTWIGIDTANGSGFSSVLSQNSGNIFYGSNGCEVAYNATYPSFFNQGSIAASTVTCQRQTGTWTPTLAGSTAPGSTTYSTQIGTWEQNTAQMTVKFSIVTSAALSGMTGNMTITGLPQPGSSVSGTGLVGSCGITDYQGITLDAGSTQVGAGITNGSPGIALYESGSAVSTALLAVANFANPVILNGACTYRLY